MESRKAKSWRSRSGAYGSYQAGMSAEGSSLLPYVLCGIVGLLLIIASIALLVLGIPRPLSTLDISGSGRGTEDADRMAGPVKVMSFNIHYGYGYTNAEKDAGQVYSFLDQIALIISQADIVALQEIDLSVGRSNRIDEVSYLAEKAGFSYYHFSDNWNFKLLPFLEPSNFRKMRTGHAILSKYPIKKAETITFEKPGASFWHKWFFVWRTQQVADIDVDGTTLKVFNVHLESESKEDRESQAAQLVSMINSSKTPVIALGDFNALMPEASDKDFPGENYLDDDTIPIVRTSGLRELFPPDQYTKDETRYFTFPSRDPDRRLDYFYYFPDIDISSASVLSGSGSPDDKEDKGDYREASDHLPVLVLFRFR